MCVCGAASGKTDTGYYSVISRGDVFLAAGFAEALILFPCYALPVW